MTSEVSQAPILQVSGLTVQFGGASFMNAMVAGNETTAGGVTKNIGRGAVSRHCTACSSRAQSGEEVPVYMKNALIACLRRLGVIIAVATPPQVLHPGAQPRRSCERRSARRAA